MSAQALNVTLDTDEQYAEMAEEASRPDDPEPIAAALEAAAEKAEKDAVWRSNDERAIAQAQRAATHRRLAAVLREPGFEEVRDAAR